MHDTAWRPHPPFEEELPPGYSWCSYPDAGVFGFPDDDAAVIFPLPVSDGTTNGHSGPEEDWQREPPGSDDLPLGPPAEPQRLCVVIGTPGAGKTSLVVAWARHAGAPAPTPGAPSIVQGDGFQAWSDDADAAFEHPGRRSVARLRDGTLRVQPERGEAEHWTLREPHADAIFEAASAAPRAARQLGLFASPSSAPGQAWTSVALVLCIDGEQPQRDLWQRVLPRQIEAWNAAAASEPTLGGGPLGHAPFDRVLVLLTKTDRFCARARSAAQQGRGRAHKALAAMKPEDMAKRLDPTHQVRAVIGEGLLDQLLGSLKPGATLAAGLVSTFGFGASLPGTANALPPWRSAAWQPFGVRAAFSYLDGAPPSFPLAALDREALRRELVTIAQ